jgi:light-regulated signal transduction histidine kinase (bacteriophytochrome)
MRISKSKTTILLSIALCIFVAIFIADLLTPLEYSHWFLYILPMLVVYLTENVILTYLVLVISIPALVIGHLHSPELPEYENIHEISTLNRTIGFFVLLIFTIIINKLIQARKHYRILVSELSYANNELESFSYSAAHDLKTPLRAIKGFSQILIEDYGKNLNEQANDCLVRIVNSSCRMTILIDDMLSLSKISLKEMVLQNVDISAIAESIVAELKATSPERNVEVHINKDMKAMADSGLIRIVMANLIGNAWKYTSKKENAKISIESKFTKSETIFIIKDNGSGFDMKFAENLFTPFKRLHSATEFQGTGIGLSIVERVIRRHQGRVWAESEINNGASFYFTLPR